MKKHSLQAFKDIARKKGGKCTSKSYQNIFAKLSFVCAKGHPWTTSGQSIIGGSWCPECAEHSSTKLKSIKNQRKYTAKIKEIIGSKSGKLISPSLVTSSVEKIVINCEVHGQFTSTPNTILDGAWCRQCGLESSARLRRTPFAKVLEIIKAKNGTIKTTEAEYLASSKVKIRFVCENGHECAIPYKYLARKNWCRRCAIDINNQAKRTDINVLKALARHRKGALISKEYINNSTPLIWSCGKHTWEASAGSVMGSKNQPGTWCPVCKHSRSEELCRLYLEAMLGSKFLKVRPKWLQGKKGYPLELDGYSEELKIAFEHQGSHHYISNRADFNSPLKQVQSHDEIKRRVLKERGIQLIEIPELHSRLPQSKLFSFLKSELTKRGYGKQIRIKSDSEIDMSSMWTRTDEKYLRLAHEIAKERGGKCLSTVYISSQSPMLWQCRKKHVPWEASLQSVKNKKSWCPECAGNKKLDNGLEQAHELAKKNGGLCLSKKYVNARENLIWKCANGHPTWIAPLDRIKSGKWCRHCRNEETARKNRGTIGGMREIAKKRGGKCLSTEYVNSQSLLLWECKEGHSWEAAPNNVKNGTWCKICSFGNQWQKRKKLK